jgi:hypothetical protein
MIHSEALAFMIIVALLCVMLLGAIVVGTRRSRQLRQRRDALRRWMRSETTGVRAA